MEGFYYLVGGGLVKRGGNRWSVIGKMRELLAGVMLMRLIRYI